MTNKKIGPKKINQMQELKLLNNEY